MKKPTKTGHDTHKTLATAEKVKSSKTSLATEEPIAEKDEEKKAEDRLRMRIKKQ